MAVAAISVYDTISIRPRGFIVTFATTLGNADQTAPMRLSGNVAQLNVIFSGTLGGATRLVEGSWDGTNWGLLHDADGTDLTSAAALGADGATVENVRECNMPYIRAATTGGSTTALAVKFVGQFAAP